MPDDDSSEFQVSVQAPEGTSLEATQVLVARIARDIRQLDGVRYTIASVADTEQRNPYQGTIYVRLVNIADRELRPVGDDGLRAEEHPAEVRGRQSAHQRQPGVAHVRRRHDQRPTSST